ncbi:glycoside hydrolase family 16 protein [Micromonospora sp. MMS20-R2-29]|uniref:Glycoside hydrolase family 16 protein n=2 Tax=Micromonospora humidisoli TaxID=2807622 RepID=A0ABS2JKN3_9ACTN|nr:glycoside hydrolase family 16 protein [Micromonospora humidisoli]
MSRHGIHRAFPAISGRRKAVVLSVLSVTAVGGIMATMMPLIAAEVPPITLSAVADTTVTQVPQDGDNGVKTTLASCPQLCDGNRNGRRDAVLEFQVRGLPADAVDVKASLRVYAWQQFSSRVRAHAAQGTAVGAGAWDYRPALGPVLSAVDRVAQGYNEWDVTAAVTGNGPVTFALTQENWNTRIYWASRENAKAAIRPSLVLTYQRSDRTPTRPPATTTAPTTAAPSPTRTSPSPSPKPTRTVSPPAPTTTAPRPTPTVRPGTDVPGWRLVWSDEFTGPTVDLKRWNLRDNEGRDIDKGCNVDDPDNTFVADGVLTLRAQRETAVCSSQTRQYTQSYLDTIGKASFTYGRFEMRAKSPNGPTDSKGLWPAFWLRPDDGGKGEIDVVELPGGSSLHGAATQAIFYDYTPVKQDQRWDFPTGYPGDGFHTYTTEWEPGVIRWYIDGRQVWQRDRSTTPWFDEAFNKPFNLRLNFQVGGWLGDPDAATRFPADFRVDYVRVWQR